MRTILAAAVLCLAVSARADKLEKAMETVNDNIKAVAAMAKAGAIDFDKATAAAATAREAAAKAALLEPRSVAKIAEAAAREAEQKVYREMLAKLDAQFGALEEALGRKDPAGVRSALDSLLATRKEGHDRFKTED